MTTHNAPRRPPTPKGTPVRSAKDQDPTKWGINKNKGTAVHRDLNSSEQGKFDTFQNAIHNEGLHPRDAAARLGSGTDYKRLEGQSNNQNIHQIRLSQDQRATFNVDDENRMVTLHGVGGHTKSKKNN